MISQSLKFIYRSTLFGVIALLATASLKGQQTFKVADVEIAEDWLYTTAPSEILVEKLNYKPRNPLEKDSIQIIKELIHSSAPDSLNLVASRIHPVVDACYHAYGDHRPLTLSPDMLWLMILQGFSIHLQVNSKELQDLVVDHEGKLTIEINRSVYLPNDANYWQGVAAEFVGKISKHIGEDLSTVSNTTFSTTNIIEETAFNIAMMDATSPYFEFRMSVSCGIPQITLEGKPQDWKLILDRVDLLKKYQLEWWVDKIRPHLEQFYLASLGKADPAFWNSIFIHDSKFVGCATEHYYSGWIFDFFPYLSGSMEYRENPLINNKNRKLSDLKKIPTGISKVPVKLNNNGKNIALSLHAGFIGIQQDKETKTLRPSIHWFVSKEVK